MRTYLEHNEGHSFKGSDVLESKPELHNEKSGSTAVITTRTGASRLETGTKPYLLQAPFSSS